VAPDTPLGSDAFVEDDARSRTETVASQVTTLAIFPIGRQDGILSVACGCLWLSVIYKSALSLRLGGALGAQRYPLPG
jgi:hypothetical protein